MDTSKASQSHLDKVAVSRGLRVVRLGARKFFRDSSFALICIAAIVGGFGGGIATTMLLISTYLHRLLFGLDLDARLSSVQTIDARRVFGALLIGGALVCLLSLARRKSAAAIIDPIEANALYGGRMSFSDSAFVALQSLVSSGCGASLGLEGGFTQMSSAIGSSIAQVLRRRRHDARMLVGAGAAGAIAGAFGAPMAGAAYGFEVILGSYTVPNLAPIVAAAVTGQFVGSYVTGQGYHLELASLQLTNAPQMALLVILGIVCGLLAVALMLIVTSIESFAKAHRISVHVRPLIGGLAVACLGLVTPHALGSGHGGVETVLKSPGVAATVALVLVAKIAASAISIGSGFRGGLFSTSLFLGALTGTLMARLAIETGIVPFVDTPLFALVGMASFAAAVIGAPLTMSLLAMEITSTLFVISPLLIGVVVAMLTVRQSFGYSFATWRFHLRGEAIRGAQDVGWLRDLSVDSLMRSDLTIVAHDMTLAEMRSRHLVGSTKRTAVVDESGRLLGLLDLTSVDPSADGDEPVGLHVTQSEAIIERDASLERTIGLFEKFETETLIVVDNLTSRRPLGLISEGHTLRRYRLEMERRQLDLFGG